MKQLYIFILLTFTCSTSFAQYFAGQNKVWTFGNRAGVDFSSGTPTAFSSAISTSEGCASVSTATGSLMFYTEGTKVWNRTHSIMTSGSAIAPFGTASSTQGALILPVVDTTSKFYVFSLENVFGSSAGTFCRLIYCKVDMALSGGLGDVVSSTINTPIAGQLAEKLCAVAGTGCSYWVIAHKLDSNVFLSYKVDITGVNTTPVVSRVGRFFGSGSYGAYGIGVLKASPDRTKLVSQSYSPGTTGAQGTQLFDFDPATGRVSNCRVLDSVNSGYGAEFSPDNSKLYTDDVVGSGARISQYDISSGVEATIIASRYTVATGSGYPQMNLGPDGKLYMIGISGTGFLDAINSPNTSGAGCGFTSHAVTLSSGTNGIFGLPNLVVSAGGSGDTTHHDSIVCVPRGGSINITSHVVGSSYLWNDGATTPTRAITSYGYYVVQANAGCVINIDSIHIIHPPTDSVTYVHDTTICSINTPLTLSTPGTFYSTLWQDGTTTPSIAVSTSGVYWRVAYDECDNKRTDTFHIVVLPADTQSHTYNLSLCQADTIYLAAASGYTSFLWSDGSTTPTITVLTPGTYYVVALGSCAIRYDTFIVAPKSLSIDLGPDVTVCKNFEIAVPLAGPTVSYLWNDGTRGRTYSAYRTGQYKVIVKDGSCVTEDSIYVTFTHISHNIKDTEVCKDQPINVNLQVNVPPGGSLMWNDGETSPFRTVHDSGAYWVYISVGDCQILDTVRINTVYCNCWYTIPTGFTPNNDGQNDVFKPRLQPGCPVSGYHFTVFNRWGQEVFSSDFRDKGWDGYFKGEPADLGVYYYNMEAYIGDNIKKITTSGNVTLVR